MKDRPLVLAITGASGAVYAVRLLELLLAADQQVHLVVSPSGESVIRQELGCSLRVHGTETWHELLASGHGLMGRDRSPVSVAPESLERDAAIREKARTALEAGRIQYHGYRDYFTPIASGSHLTRAMIICPCSGSTLSGIVRSASSNLIERAAEVHLKERRPLIVIPRETPLSTFQIENMLRASQAGIVVLPAAPGWYHGVTRLADLVDFVVARILDQLEIEHSLMRRWSEPTIASEPNE